MEFLDSGATDCGACLRRVFEEVDHLTPSQGLPESSAESKASPHPFHDEECHISALPSERRR